MHFLKTSIYSKETLWNLVFLYCLISGIVEGSPIYVAVMTIILVGSLYPSCRPFLLVGARAAQRWNQRRLSAVRPLRVVAYRRAETEYGYIGTYLHDYQDLQERHWWGWKTIDTEAVPSSVIIARGALGYDTQGWRSKFLEYGSFGRDGMVQSHPTT